MNNKMEFYKQYDSGLKLVIKRIEGAFTVSSGIIVSTGSRNEDKSNNGISHFIEHVTFKGTKKRTAFEISDEIDGIGSTINAFTSKECTCYYTKSIVEHQNQTFDVLADIFLNSVYPEEELDKERGVIIEEINMTEDTPDEVCLDLLSEAFYGDSGLGQTILGPEENVRRFTKKDIYDYLEKYYTPDNICISVAGAVDIKETEKIVDKYFKDFKGFGSASTPTVSAKKDEFKSCYTGNVHKKKDIEQAHIAMAFPAYRYGDEKSVALSIACSVLGGTMSSRLFQTVREEQGLCYTVYSYLSQYLDTGKIEIYAGVNPKNREKALQSILKVVNEFKNGITDAEFSRGKEQLKSAFIMSRESTSSEMQVYAKGWLLLGEPFDFNKKINEINSVTKEEVEAVIKEIFDVSKCAFTTVGRKDEPLVIE